MPELAIEIIFAHQPDHYWRQSLRVAEGSTIAQVLQASHLFSEFTDLDLKPLGIGVFGKKQSLNYKVTQGDRIELYRALSFDPKESRKRRAIHRKAGILRKKHLKPDRSKKIEFDEYQ